MLTLTNILRDKSSLIVTVRGGCDPSLYSGDIGNDDY